MADIDRIVGWLVDRAQRSERSIRDTKLADHVPGRVKRGTAGACYVVEHRSPVRIDLPDKDRALAAIFSELRLVFGIGRTNAERLVGEGFDSIRALLSHPRWSAAARSLLDHWGDPIDPRRVYATMSYWLSASHPLFLSLPALASPDKVCFFDLETLGLFGSPVFLAGIGRPRPEGGVTIIQYLARSLDEEIGLLAAVREELAGCLFLVTYNGKAFDWTTVNGRLAYYSLPPLPEPLHLDLLHHARRRFGGDFPDLRLGTVERELFGMVREGDLPGEDVPVYYSEYLETGDPRPLIPILNHNHQDVETLAVLFSHLREDQDERDN